MKTLNLIFNLLKAANHSIHNLKITFSEMQLEARVSSRKEMPAKRNKSHSIRHRKSHSIRHSLKLLNKVVSLQKNVNSKKLQRMTKTIDEIAQSSNVIQNTSVGSHRVEPPPGFHMSQDNISRLSNSPYSQKSGGGETSPQPNLSNLNG